MAIFKRKTTEELMAERKGLETEVRKAKEREMEEKRIKELKAEKRKTTFAGKVATGWKGVAKGTVGVVTMIMPELSNLAVIANPQREQN